MHNVSVRIVAVCVRGDTGMLSASKMIGKEMEGINNFD